MIEELERLTREYFDEDTTSTHLDYATAQIESGVPIAGLADKLSANLNVPIQRQVLSAYLHTFEGAKERLSIARPLMAYAMIEDAITLVDQKPLDKLDLAHNAAKARTRENVAKMMNPEFMANKQQGVTLNIGSLHLDALRAPVFTRSDSHASLHPDAGAVTFALPNSDAPLLNAPLAHARVSLDAEGSAPEQL